MQPGWLSRASIGRPKRAVGLDGAPDSHGRASASPRCGRVPRSRRRGLAAVANGLGLDAVASDDAGRLIEVAFGAPKTYV